LSEQANRNVRNDGAEEEIDAQLQPGRYYLLGDASSFFFGPAGDNDGFESPEAAAAWARTQPVWPDLDLSDGYSVQIVIGASSTRTRRGEDVGRRRPPGKGWGRIA
jgi:hypothetical protein